ncbi:MAG: hypothetical protein ACYDBQ_06165 [Thermoplasmatota archaeon]
MQNLAVAANVVRRGAAASYYEPERAASDVALQKAWQQYREGCETLGIGGRTRVAPSTWRDVEVPKRATNVSTALGGTTCSAFQCTLPATITCTAPDASVDWRDASRDYCAIHGRVAEERDAISVSLLHRVDAASLANPYQQDGILCDQRLQYDALQWVLHGTTGDAPRRQAAEEWETPYPMTRNETPCCCFDPHRHHGDPLDGSYAGF